MNLFDGATAEVNFEMTLPMTASSRSTRLMRSVIGTS
jgi:hypothetical protein